MKRYTEQFKACRELRQVERELARYAEAIARGGDFPAVLEAMGARERRRAALEGGAGRVRGP